MRALILAPLFGVVLMAQMPPALDIVLLVEDSIAATGAVRRPDLRALLPGDRVAVMSFAGKQSLKVPLEADRVKIDKAIGKLDARGARSSTRLWDAIVKATGLFDATPDSSRRRAVFLIFLAEDKSSAQTVDSARAALSGRQISLSAATIFLAPRPSAIPRVQTTSPRRCQGPQGRVPCVPVPPPGGQRPDVWPEGVPVSQGSVLPGEALRLIEMLATETGGLVLKNTWDFTKLAEHARSH